MKVRCNEVGYRDITKGTVYKVVTETLLYYYITADDGLIRSYSKDDFEEVQDEL